jgi:gamma-glutamyltranspeptidase/glutathione hydrolase
MTGLRSSSAFAGLVGSALVTGVLAAVPAGAHSNSQNYPVGARPGVHRSSPSPVGNEPKVPVMTGSGGAVASVDRDASQVGLNVLASGANAADAAVATAAALGVTEPYSTGIGGGGFLVYYDARRHTVRTIDGRETAPASYTSTTFTKPDGTPMDFNTVVNSGLSIGVPGTPALWARATSTFGTRPLSALLKPAQDLAERGFVVDQTFHDQTAANAARFAKFPATAAVFLPGGQPPAVGSTFRNPDMAKAYAELRAHGVSSIYQGTLGQAILAEADRPHTTPGTTVTGGQLTMADLQAYRAPTKAPIHSRYDGLDVYGMPQPSSGGIAVAETLNLLAAYEKKTHTSLEHLSNAEYLHYFSEATATAFADRNRYVGDVPGVPVQQLISPAFAAERACGFDPSAAQQRPIPFGNPDGSYTTCSSGSTTAPEAYEGTSTSHLVVTDRWGDVASYTLTIEQTGGSAITVPGWGFLLNNELTDFSFVPVNPGVPDPNLPGPHKRPRSSMSPTILLRDGRPYLAVGSPGGATIITTVCQVLTEYLDRDKTLLDAIAAPRLSSRNGAEQAEPALINSPDGTTLSNLGHVLVLPPAPPEIGAAVGIRILRPNLFQAVAEPVRRGGGSAMVVHPHGQD